MNCLCLRTDKVLWLVHVRVCACACFCMWGVGGGIWQNKRYAQALELAKKDKLYKDAMATAATSQVRLLRIRMHTCMHSACAFAYIHTCSYSRKCAYFIAHTYAHNCVYNCIYVFFVYLSIHVCV